MGGKFWRINYPEEKVRGKDGAKPLNKVATLMVLMLRRERGSMYTNKHMVAMYLYI